MSSSFTRWLAVGTASAIALLGVTAQAPSAQAAVDDVATQSAATWVATHLPSKKDTGANLNAALALTAAGQCSYVGAIDTLVDRLEDQAAT